MSNEEINKYLTEAMGECWHEAGSKRRIWDARVQRDCSCGESSRWEHITTDVSKYRFLQNDFSTWTGYGKLRGFYDGWGQSRRLDFWTFIMSHDLDKVYRDDWDIAIYVFHKDRLAPLMYEFLKEDK
jgi:hypothetical protein